MTPSEFCEMFDAGKTSMIGLPYGEKNCDNMLNSFHMIWDRYVQTDGQTDGLTELIYQYRVSGC